MPLAQARLVKKCKNARLITARDGLELHTPSHVMLQKSAAWDTFVGN